MTDRFVGVQLTPSSIYDEGVDHVLNVLQDTGINTLLVASHTYNGAVEGRSRDALADHGVPIKDPATRRLTRVWVETHDEYYAGTLLRNVRSPERDEFADRDVLADLYEPARKRGMKLYVRMLEGVSPVLIDLIPNWSKVLTIDVYGRPTSLPCWNNPNYRNWWLATVEDLFKTHKVDGLQWGAERVGPLSKTLFHGDVPMCFCEHCQERARKKGIDVERARQGFRQLYEFIAGLEAGQAGPGDGILVNVLRFLLKYPEILMWERQWREAKEELAQLIYGTVKLINPGIPVGRHIDHQQSSWDIIFKAEMSYDEMLNHSDFIKPILYHDILGPRLRWWYLERLHKSILREISLEQSLELFYDVMGYDKTVEPKLAELGGVGMSPDYVYKMTRQIVDGVKGQIPVYAGIGFDVPWGGLTWDEMKWGRFAGDPEKVYQSVLRAFEAGASGIVVSRAYDEMRMENLKAVGRALGDVNKAGL